MEANRPGPNCFVVFVVVLMMMILTMMLYEGLEISRTTLAGLWHYSVRCTSAQGLSRGTRFGPYSGRVVSITEIKFSDDNSFMWEVSVSLRLYVCLAVWLST